MNLSSISDAISTATKGTFMDNLSCSCTNEYVAYAIVLLFCIFFWALGYKTGGYVRKTP